MQYLDNTVKMYYYLFDLNLNLFLTLKRQITEYFEINLCTYCIWSTESKYWIYTDLPKLFFVNITKKRKGCINLEQNIVYLSKVH